MDLHHAENAVVSSELTPAGRLGLLLEEIGVDSPHLRGERVVRFLHDLERAHEAELRRDFKEFRRLIEIRRAWERRGDTFAPNRDDVLEADARIRAMRGAA